MKKRRTSALGDAIWRSFHLCVFFATLIHFRPKALDSRLMPK